MVVFLYLHAVSHRQLYVTFFSRVKHWLDDLCIFNVLVLTRASSFAMVAFVYLHGQLYHLFPAGLKLGWMTKKI